ncbi:peptide ABC transporter substrate-binding protein [Arenimonas soli]|uniref:Peptide ABC transporter substrate-binding protein n=1 Tax=Arenimonas soli TaxID=2269504 RepID=A0ABQ1HP96_9GAMM|nr:peptide ABC transporter substrate-binding protein [Arenimonas soli]GGA83115.1 peptide ABC transporter substrate-binding protein [Arenimonas soli]
MRIVTRAVALGVLLAGLHCSGVALAQTLERGNGPEPSTLDPHRCPEVACANILRDLFEGLVAEDGAGRLVPGLAERWSVSGDGRSWTFHLRPDARWSNGEALDARQVLASLRRAFDPATAAPFAGHLDAIENAGAVQRGQQPPESLGVAAPDPATLVFTLRRSADLPRLLTLPVAYPVYLPGLAEHGARHTRPGNLVSNGAYRLADWLPQAQVTLEANPHFREPPPIPRVRFHVTEDAASELRRFEAGGLHITETLPPQPLVHLRERFGDQLRISPYLGSFWLGFNLERPPFKDDPALREALSLAVDRDILTRHVTGLGESPAWGVVPPGVAGYDAPLPPAAAMTQAQREARARALYAQAGYSPENPLQVELRYNTSTPHRRLALAVAAMWRETLGVQTRLRNEEWKVFVGTRRQRVITQVFRGGWIADIDDARNFLDTFRSDSASNWSGHADPTYDALLDAADAAPTLARRQQLLHRAEARLQAAQAVLPLYHYTSKHLVHPDVQGFEANPLDRHPSRFLRLRD